MAKLVQTPVPQAEPRKPLGLPYAEAGVDDEGYYLVCPSCKAKMRPEPLDVMRPGVVEDHQTKAAADRYAKHYEAAHMYGGFTTDELKEAFDRVHDPDNWKNAIDALLPGTLSRDEQRVITEAVVFYTGSMPEIVPDDGHGNHPGWDWQDAAPPDNHPPFWRVTAAGYYVCIGS